jgi:apolipoprotein N-acyltransferase
VPAFVGLVPLLVFIAERPTGPVGRWSATRGAALTGLLYFGLQLYWIAIALAPETLLAVPAFGLFVIVLAGFTALFGWALHYTLERLGLPLALLAALLWTALEWTQGRLGDLSFPWLGLGHALAPFPEIAGAADLVGARGLTLWLAAVNGLLAMALVRYRQGPAHPGSRRLIAAAIVLATIPALYGIWRSTSLELRPAARVAIVQPNIPQEIKRDHALALDMSMIVLTRLTRAVGDEGESRDQGASGGAGESREPGEWAVGGERALGGERVRVDLVAWPEVALTADLGADPALLDEVRELSHLAGAPILAGAFGGDGAANGEGAGDGGGDASGSASGGVSGGVRPRFNSAYLVTDGGIVGERYDKRRMVAFVERVPFVGGGLEKGRGGALFRTRDGGDPARGAAFGVLICYESAFADLARRYRQDGAEFLVNITNDAWFGREPWYARTTALWQHPAHMTMRAIENRMGVARAANTGISMFIDPVGRVERATPLFVDGVLVHTVLTTDTVTLFSRWGDWLATLATAAAALLLMVARLRPTALYAGNVGTRGVYTDPE